MAPRPICQRVITTPNLWHLAMAPYYMVPNNGTWLWFPAIINTIFSLKECITSSPTYYIQQLQLWTRIPSNVTYYMIPTMTSNNGTLPWDQSIVSNYGILPSYLTMAPSNDTTSTFITTYYMQHHHLIMRSYHTVPSNGILSNHLFIFHLTMPATQQWHPSNGSPAIPPCVIRYRPPRVKTVQSNLPSQCQIHWDAIDPFSAFQCIRLPEPLFFLHM